MSDVTRHPEKPLPPEDTVPETSAEQRPETVDAVDDGDAGDGVEAAAAPDGPPDGPHDGAETTPEPERDAEVEPDPTVEPEPSAEPEGESEGEIAAEDERTEPTEPTDALPEADSVDDHPLDAAAVDAAGVREMTPAEANAGSAAGEDSVEPTVAATPDSVPAGDLLGTPSAGADDEADDEAADDQEAAHGADQEAIEDAVEPVPETGSQAVPRSPEPTEESEASVDELEPPSPVGSEDYLAAAAEGAAVTRDPVEGKAAWRRMLLMGRPRATRANLLGALLAVLLGAGIAAQVQLTNERGLAELSQSDLVRVLDDVSVRSSRLDQQVRELEATRDRLKSGTGTTAEALAQAQKRIDTLGILAGTVGARGPGITLTISDPDNQVGATLILDMIQELRDAGAEAIDVGGARVVASSFVGSVGGDILIDGKKVSRPLEIRAIGDSKTLSSAMTIPGGIVETVRQQNAEATVTESQNIEITSVHEPSTFSYAKPVE